MTFFKYFYFLFFIQNLFLDSAERTFFSIRPSDRPLSGYLVPFHVSNDQNVFQENRSGKFEQLQFDNANKRTFLRNLDQNIELLKDENLEHSTISAESSEEDFELQRYKSKIEKLNAELIEKEKKILMSIDVVKLNLRDKSNNELFKIDFANLNTFRQPKISKDQFLKLKSDKKPLSDQQIFDLFTSYYLYNLDSFRSFIKTIPSYPRFILTFDQELKNNRQFLEKFKTVPNSGNITKFINNESNVIRCINETRQLDASLKEVYIPANKLVDLRDQFQDQYANSNDPILRQRIDAINKTLESDAKVRVDYKLTPFSELFLKSLRINQELFTTKTGSCADQQLHQEFVNYLNHSAALFNSRSPEVQIYALQASDFIKKGIQLNDTNKSLAYLYADAVKDITSFCQGIQDSFKDNVVEIKKFLSDPINTTVEKAKNLIHLAQNVVISTSKAFIWTMLNLPDLNDYSPGIESIRQENVQIKAKEITEACNHLMKILEHMPREEKLKNAGFIVSEFILSNATGKLSSKILSLKSAGLKRVIEKGAQRFNKIGRIGQEISKVTGLAVEKGLNATDAILDHLKANPKIAINKGGIFNFSAEAFDKRKIAVNSLKEAQKIKKLNNYHKMPKGQLLKSKRKYQKLIEEHLQKIELFKQSPDMMDENGLLKNISLDLRNKKIIGRINHWETEIRGFKKNINEINQILKDKFNSEHDIISKL